MVLLFYCTILNSGRGSVLGQPPSVPFAFCGRQPDYPEPAPSFFCRSRLSPPFSKPLKRMLFPYSFLPLRPLNLETPSRPHLSLFFFGFGPLSSIARLTSTVPCFRLSFPHQPLLLPSNRSVPPVSLHPRCCTSRLRSIELGAET